MKVGDVAVAHSLYDLFDEERIPVEQLLPALEAWRAEVLARGGGFEIPETYRRNPMEMPPGPG